MFLNIFNLTTTTITIMKYIIFFTVVNKDDVIKTGCHKSLFITNKDEYTVGQHFNHHYYNVDCVVDKIENKQ